MSAIEMVSQARQLLERAKAPDEWRSIIQVASAAKVLLKGRDDAHAAWLAAGEIELRAKKRLADFVMAHTSGQRGRPGDNGPDRTIMQEAWGAQGRSRHECRRLAELPEEVFEQRLTQALDEGRMPTLEAIIKPAVSDAADYDGDSWCTPKEWIDMAREVMGSIDVDPATNPHGQSIVQATTYYTKDDDGLTKPWTGNVWLNPPYSTALIQRFAERVLVQDFDQAIVLTNNCTDAGWWQSLSAACALIALPRGRIAFEHPKTGAAFATRQGQTFFYFGARSERFAEVFSRNGKCSVFARMA